MSTNQSGNGPVETKVTVAGLASAITSALMGYVLLGTDFSEDVNTAVSVIILGAVTSVLTFGAAWWAKHTNRTDAQAARGKHV